jgi:hypothetical protein
MYGYKSATVGHICASILGYWQSLETNSIATLTLHHGEEDQNTLEYWKDHISDSPHLNVMAHNVLLCL